MKFTIPKRKTKNPIQLTKTRGVKLEHDAIGYFIQKLMRKNFYSGKAARRKRRKDIRFQLVSLDPVKEELERFIFPIKQTEVRTR